MARETKFNRFANAGQALIEAEKPKGTNTKAIDAETKETLPKKNKIVSAKVYPETWADFTAINRAQGMTNNSVINMLISEYVRNKKEEVLG